jgi:glutamate racemase
MKMKEKAIGVFDSGLGGLAVARKVMDKMPEEDIVYFADFAHLPYGP